MKNFRELGSDREVVDGGVAAAVWLVVAME
jgi:hypothetical protein